MMKIKTFILHQYVQIRKGGIRIIVQKMKKMVWLLWMNICAPVAVKLNLNWPRAYSFMGLKKKQKLKALRSQPKKNHLESEKIEDQIIHLYKAIVESGPDSVDEQEWFEASRILGTLYLTLGKIDEMDAVFKKEAEVCRKISKKRQYGELGIEFLPRNLAMGSIGNYELLDVYVKAGILGLRPPKNLILLVDPNVAVNNPCYLNYWRRYITVISDPVLIEMLAPLEKRFTMPINLYMVLKEKMHKSFLALGLVREQWIKEDRSPILTLLDEDYKRGWECLKSFGLQKNDWFVCLHVRQKGYNDINSSSEDFRNSDIDTYMPAIKAITDAGGWVVCMGDPSMKPLPEMPRVINYAHSDSKSDWMDVFLCAQSRFFLATSSGLCTFAMAFGTPVVMTNLLPSFACYYFSSNDLFIPRVCEKDNGKGLLKFSEQFSPPMGTAASQYFYDKKGIRIIPNTGEDIRGIVEEMLERCSGCCEVSEEDKKLQKRFKSMAFNCGKLYGDENASANTQLGKVFLRKHTTLLPNEGADATQVEIERANL